MGVVFSEHPLYGNIFITVSRSYFSVTIDKPEFHNRGVQCIKQLIRYFCAQMNDDCVRNDSEASGYMQFMYMTSLLLLSWYMKLV